MARCPECHAKPDAEWVELQRRSKNGNGNGTSRRWWCRQCHRSFGETAGTAYYRSRVPRDGMLQAVRLWFYGETTRNIAEAVGVNKDTVTRLLDQAAAYPEEIVNALMAQEWEDVDERVATAIGEQLHARQRAKLLRKQRVRSRQRRRRAAPALAEPRGTLALANQ